MNSTTALVLSHRDRAILRAVAAGRASVTPSSEPDLYIDGLCCCDQTAAHNLCHAGLICPALPGMPGQAVLAALTAAGTAALAVLA